MMRPLAPDVRAQLLDLANRIEHLQPNDPRRLLDQHAQIAFALRMLARGFVVTGKDRVRGWTAEDAS